MRAGCLNASNPSSASHIRALRASGLTVAGREHEREAATNAEPDDPDLAGAVLPRREPAARRLDVFKALAAPSTDGLDHRDYASALLRLWKRSGATAR